MCACEVSPCFCFASVLSQFGGEQKMEALKSEFLMGLHSLLAWLWEFSRAPQWECVKRKDHMYSCFFFSFLFFLDL